MKYYMQANRFLQKYGSDAFKIIAAYEEAADIPQTERYANWYGDYGIFEPSLNENMTYDKAMYYLHLAAEHGNQYAAQLIHSIRVNGNWTAALASLRLLGHMARIIQNRLEDERKNREHSIDRKLRKKIEEKKQAHGLKQ